MLGVSKRASQDEIKKAYRELAKKWHPDRHQGESKKNAEQKFKEISSAYETIGDADKRRAFDRRGRGMDPFSSFFHTGWVDNMFRRQKPKGQNLRILLELELEEVAQGGPKRIEITRLADCAACDGTGAEGGELSTCPTCEGAGVVSTHHRKPGVLFTSQAPCIQCKGRGQIPKQTCKQCQGRMQVEQDEVIEVPIPVGIGENQLLRVAGKGQTGPGGPGDLLIVVRSRPHKRFARKGDNVIASLTVPFLVALRGGKIEETGLLGKKYWIDIPKACEPGHWVKVPGEGINEGDFLVQLNVRLPELDDAKLDKIAELLSNE